MNINKPIKLVLENTRPYSWNMVARLHWTQYDQLMAQHHWLMRSVLTTTVDYFTEPVDIRVVSYFDKRPYDPSNVAVKLYEDGLKNFVIVDDSPKYVRRVSSECHIDRQRPRVEIFIDPATAVHQPIPKNSLVLTIDDFRPQSWNKLLRMSPPQWHTQVLATKNAVISSLNNVEYTMFGERVDIAVNLYSRSKNMDSSNVPLKLFEDGLLKSVIRDDSPRYVRRITTMSAVGSKSKVEIIITPTGERINLR